MNPITPNKSVEIEEVVEYVASVCDNVEFLRGVPVNLPSETKALLRDRIREALHQQREMMRKEIGNELLKRMMKYDSEDGYSKMHDEVMEKVARDVDDIFLPPLQ